MAIRCIFKDIASGTTFIFQIDLKMSSVWMCEFHWKFLISSKKYQIFK